MAAALTGGIWTGIRSVVNFAKNFIVGIIISVYLLAMKEKSLARCCKITYAMFRKETAVGKLDVMGLYAASGDLYSTITAIIRTLPLAPMVLVLLAAAMIAFYATSFDAIVLVASAYSYKNLTSEDEPHMAIKTFWSLSLILLPMVLIFSDNSMANLQTVSIIAAFPIAFIILLIVAAFFKDAKKYLSREI